MTNDLWQRLKSFDVKDRQRAVLETFVRMYLTVASMKPYTHVRAEMRGAGSLKWQLLDADDNEMRKEEEVEFGSAANDVAKAVLEPLVKDQPWELARMVIRFSPPTLQVDVINETNTPIFSGKLIDLDMEQQIRSQLRLEMKEE